MLTITVLGDEYFDETKQEFITRNDVVLDLEHSLVSLSKWEQKWEKPFLSGIEKSSEETLDYIRMMTLTPNVPEEVYLRFSEANFMSINTYLNAKMTATWFSEDQKGKSREIVTSEILYYWMISLSIPIEWETRHLSTFMTLIKVFNEKNSPKKKMTQSELAARNRRINEERRAQHNTAG